MSDLAERLRNLLTRPAFGATWDDSGEENIATLAVGLAAAWDAYPGDPRVAASRSAVLGAFAALHSVAQGAAGRALPRTGAAPGVRRGRRRAVFALVTAGFLLAMSLATVAASAPGGPLYDARVAVEGVFLPAAAADRLAAQVARLDARITEASGAASRADVLGMEAALDAYARIADQAAVEASAQAAADPATRLRAGARVWAQVEIISRFEGRDPAFQAIRERARRAAGVLLGALGQPDHGTPGPVLTPSATTAPPQGGTPSATPGPQGTPRGSSQPGGGPGPGTSGSPDGRGGPGGSPAPGGGDPGQTAAPSASDRTRPGDTPRPTAPPTPATTAKPSPTGGGSGPGTPGSGGDASPSQGDGSGNPATQPISTPSPGGGP